MSDAAEKKVPTIGMTAVDSSQLKEHGYDAASRTLAVRFNGNNRLYHYDDVPQETYDALCKAESFGRFFNQELRGKFTYRAIDEKPANAEEAQ